jgi:hypothetical protein
VAEEEDDDKDDDVFGEKANLGGRPHIFVLYCDDFDFIPTRH